MDRGAIAAWGDRNARGEWLPVSAAQ